MKAKLVWRNVKVKLGDLQPWTDNPRLSTKAQAKRILDSFGEFGQVEVFAIGPKCEVYDGHQRLSALLTLHGKGYSIDARQSNRPLTEAERKRLVLMLHTGATGQWDWDRLANWDAELLKASGFDDDLLANMRREEAAIIDLLKSEEEGESADAEPQIDRAAELNEKWKVKRGDLWRIGEHRLLCGDSTVREDVERVMQGEKAEAMFTDPPYGIGMSPASVARHLPSLDNDKLNENDFWVFLTSFLKHAREFVEGEGFVCCDWRRYGEFQRAMAAEGWTVSNVIVWNKETLAQNLNRFAFVHEFIAYSGPMGAPTIDTNVWTVPREYSDVHLTPKPVDLVERAIKTTGRCIYEPFAGSGSTLVACQNLNRKCRAIEISPAYCAVILQRMADAFPSLPIERVSNG